MCSRQFFHDYSFAPIRCFFSNVNCLNLSWDSAIFFPINPFAPGDFTEKRALKLVERFSGHYGAIKI